MATNIKDDLTKNLPRFPRTTPPYRIHWNWELSYRCNYKCSYCQYWAKGGKEEYLYVDINRWKEIWDRIFEKYWSSHIRFSGGEPTIYPNFFDLVAILLEKNTVDITTNLSFDINLFTKKVKPGAISISASFHPEFDEIKSFLDKILFLHHDGYPSTISYVAYPPHLEKIAYFKSIAEEKEIMFKIIPFQGRWRGKHYPQDYTTEEKNILEGFTTDSQNSHLNELNTRWYEWNVKKEKVEVEKKGRLCRMGQMYAIIHPDGKVTRCCARDADDSFVETLGSIFDQDFRLLDAPSLCKADRCPCFKSMLVDYEEDKWLPLWEAPEHPVYKPEYIRKWLERDKEAKELSTMAIPSNGTEKVIAAKEASKVSRQSIPPNRVFYTWDIHYACNYRCSYCFFAKEWDVKAKENRYPDLVRWKEIWDDIFERYGSGHIHVSGGEPFTYPSFIDLVAYLTEKHTVEFDTNLSFDVLEFISKVKPGRVKFATAFHPELVSIDSYLKKALRLKKEGFDIGINYVAYPPQLDRMKKYKAAFGRHHISFDIMPFRGEYQGRIYPKEYIAGEKELIKNCDSNLAISTRMLDWYDKDKTSRKGQLCRMGQMYTKIHPNGDAYRCCYIDDRGKLGNLIDGTFSLWEEARPCEYIECPCWTAMIVGREKEWLSHWVIPK